MKKLKEKVIVLSKDNSYSREYVSSLSEIFEIYFFSDKKYFEIELEKIKPDWIFALHWNFIISEKFSKNINVLHFIRATYQKIEVDHLSKIKLLIININKSKCN